MMLQVRFSLIFFQIKFAYKYELHLHVDYIMKKYCAIIENYDRNFHHIYICDFLIINSRLTIESHTFILSRMDLEFASKKNTYKEILSTLILNSKEILKTELIYCEQY